MWPQAQDSHKSVDISPSTLLVDFMAPESRIDAHPTFEFEFGTLAYDLGDLDLTSWF
jgi:hypothetical protein